MWGGAGKEEAVLRTGFYVLGKAQSSTLPGANRVLDEGFEKGFLTVPSEQVTCFKSSGNGKSSSEN